MSDWIIAFMEQGGYFAVAALMFLENLFPPIPSEIVMPLGGYIAARDGLSLVLMVLAGTLGALAGAYFWYWIGRRIGTDGVKTFARRYGRWLTLTPQEIDTADAWFDRYGGWAVFVGRLIPGVRTFISVPAGLSEMPLGRFLLFTTLGTTLWSAALTIAGYYLGARYDAVASWTGPVSNLVIVLAVGYYLWRVATFRRRVPREEPGQEPGAPS
ncbi:DedA family protein [Litorisediminicola beolgyonensis]|uniref:DedA family protein n=1 Tax=Litorisediminicola beolgyonensis TaxID=1173614 RepID=A0ABW3ZEF5_9RHOB